MQFRGELVGQRGCSGITLHVPVAVDKYVSLEMKHVS